jgi:hypothetical protein
MKLNAGKYILCVEKQKPNNMRGKSFNLKINISISSSNVFIDLNHTTKSIDSEDFLKKIYTSAAKLLGERY